MASPAVQPEVGPSQNLSNPVPPSGRVAAGLRAELGPMFALAWPVVMAELGWMAMGTVDTLMVGRLGAEALGGVSVGHVLYITVSIFGFGLLLGLDTLVSQAFGAGDMEDCHRSLLDGVALAAILSVLLTALVRLVAPTMDHWGMDPAILPYATAYLRVMAWDIAPLLLFAAFRRYLQGMGLVKPVMFALVAGNLLNLLGNWVLIYGRLGAPALGVAGSAWSTVLSRCGMLAVLVGYTVAREVRQKTGLRGLSSVPDLGRLRRLVALGLPAAVHLELEVGVFAVATALAGRFGAAPIAAHQIALNAASLTFMVPLGISAAGAVRVGQAIGRNDPGAASRAGWTALLLGTGFMAVAALAFVAAPRAIMGAFTDEPRVIALGASLLAIAAVFQLFDGLQVVATGVLRGAGDTRTPMLCNLLAHWALGLPIGYGLGVAWGFGVSGLWVGLSAGLIAAGLVLLRVWAVKAERLGRRGRAEAPPLPVP
jgi:multidrug resistance protein, MATE family